MQVMQHHAVAGQDAENLGHSCWLFVAHRKDPSLYEHTKKEAGNCKADSSHAEAVQLLAAKLSKNVTHLENAAKRAKNQASQDQRQHVTELGLLLGCHTILQLHWIKCCVVSD